MITNTAIGRLGQLDPELRALVEEWQLHAQNREQALTVVACGLLKAGKSSLLNMLTEHTAEEYFRTGPTRETTKLFEFKTTDFVYLDTPGLDCEDADDQEALRGIGTADVLLLVHNLKEGELHQQELEWLKHIAEAASAEQLSERLLLVLTHMEATQDSYQSIAKRVVEQCRETVGVEPRWFAVSNSRYRKGACESKTLLIEKSGIPALRQHLAAQHRQLTKLALAARARKLRDRHQALTAAITRALADRRQKIEALRVPHAAALEDLQASLDALVTSARQSIARYNKIS